MNRIITGICMALLVAGCASKGGEQQQQKKAAIEQRDLFEPGAEGPLSNEEKIRREQEELQRQLEAQKRQQEEEAARQDQAEVKPLPPGGMTERSLSDPTSMLKDPDSPLGTRTIYYDFDAYNIREEFQPVVEAHAKFLLDNKDYKVRVEGNCDERGSREYNLALGQRRADSVRRAMTLMGVSAKQVETVSFGSEKPKATGSGEEAWAENRRSDIVYIGIDAPR